MLKNAPKLTIAIPTYNRGSFLNMTLESIFSQLLPDVDVFVSDNGSVDNTQEILKTYQKKFPCLSFSCFDSNQGIDRNIVNCITQAQGEYVFLFGDDDLLMPGSFEKILEVISTYSPPAICLNHFCFKGHDLTYRHTSFLKEKIKIFNQGQEFFKYCGLGFLSSLIMQKNKALPWISYVGYGKECAHLDIIGRLVLEEQGPHVFLGTVSVAGRSLEVPRYHALNSCILFPKECYDALFKEKRLTKSLYTSLISKLLYKDLPRVLAKMVLFSSEDVSSYRLKLDEAFNAYFGYKIIIYPFFLCHRAILRKGLQGLYKLRSMYKQMQYGLVCRYQKR